MNTLTAKILAVILVAGFHFSGCTGNLGLLSLALAGEAVSADAVPMSRFVVSCTQQDKTENTTKGATGCSDGKSCLQRLHLTSTERLTLLLAAGFLFVVAFVRFFGTSIHLSPLLLLARAGPLHEYAFLYAKVVVKRE